MKICANEKSFLGVSSFIRKSGALIACFVLLVGCDHGVEWRDGLYQVHWIDEVQNRKLSISVDGEDSLVRRVAPVVVAVGSNERFVVVKQILEGGSSVAYYYIDKNIDDIYLDQNEVTQGPFTKERFSELQRELDLPGFSKEFE